MKIHKEILEKLLDLDKTSTPGETGIPYLPLHLAVLDSDKDSIKLFLTSGYDLNKKDCWGRTALHYAVFQDNVDIFKKLVEHGANVHFVDYKYSGDTLLHLAASEGQMEMVRYLVEEIGVDINCLNYNNEAPISYSMLFSQTKIAEYLVEKGAINDGHISQKDVLIPKLTQRLKKLTQGCSKNIKIIPFEKAQKIQYIRKFLASL